MVGTVVDEEISVGEAADAEAEVDIAVVNRLKRVKELFPENSHLRDCVLRVNSRDIYAETAPFRRRKRSQKTLRGAPTRRSPRNNICA